MADLHRPTLPLIPQRASSSGHRYNAISEECERVGGGGDLPQSVREKFLRWASVARVARLVFVIAAPVQMIIIVIFQVLIFSYGGHGGVLREYRQCLNQTLQMALNCSVEANWSNVTIPSFGKDKPIYVGFIIALTVYNAMLCFYALYGKHFCEIIAFLIVNILTTVYAGVEVYEFRRFSNNCAVPTACWLAIASVAVLCIFTVLFVVLVVCLWRDFSKKVERDVNHNEFLTKYYQWYEVISSGIKLVILFTIVFCIAWLTLLLTPNNNEFGLTIIIVILAPVVYFVFQLTVRYNSFTGYLTIAITGMLLLGYYAFKIWRFITQSCHVCEDVIKALNKEHDALQMLLNTCTNTTNATLNLEDSDRSIQFENLYIFATVNMATTFLVFAIYLWFCCFQPGNMLATHFETNTKPSMIVRIVCCRLRNGSFFETIKEVKIKDFLQAASNWCGLMKKAVFTAKKPHDPVI